jgi:hypothetical protein
MAVTTEAMSSSLSLSLSCSANRTDKGRPACVGAAIRSNSKLPDELRGLGYDVTEIGAGERILPTAIEQWFVTGLDGELKPLTSGSTRPVAQTVTLLLNGDPKHDGHVIRDFCDTFCVPPKLILREMLSRGSFPMSSELHRCLDCVRLDCRERRRQRYGAYCTPTSETTAAALSVRQTPCQ